eukprot:TRINITY_DN120867_c0_g1_i1.p1 TRINITY_DN120867_c0_g1~~TRINITY_DN120867_c0_g1_i1.p1  ORF type:complete len:478 (-),score=78.63 TRINITY_DN120867_c0_g1_i1:115-1548(-)
MPGKSQVYAFLHELLDGRRRLSLGKWKGACKQKLVGGYSPQGSDSSPLKSGDDVSPFYLEFARCCPAQVCAPTIDQKALDGVMTELSETVEEWNGEFGLVKTLQNAARNYGRVDLMRRPRPESVTPEIEVVVHPFSIADEASEELEVKQVSKASSLAVLEEAEAEGTDGKDLVAVKRLPNEWVETSHGAFTKRWPDSNERPWVDVSALKLLGMRDSAYICRLQGIFRDETHTYIVTSFANMGDMIGWCDSAPVPGPEREAKMLPLATQMFRGVKFLHDNGVAHRDLSLENFVMTMYSSGALQVKIIDFAMSAVTRMCTAGEVRGKSSYIAPEMYGTVAYDGFAADNFSCGVVLFSMAAHDYPWTSTKKGSCQRFERYRERGFTDLVSEQQIRRRNCAQPPQTLSAVLSPGLVELVAGLVQLEPQERLTLGELPCDLSPKSRISRSSSWSRLNLASKPDTVWRTQWLQQALTMPELLR